MNSPWKTIADLMPAIGFFGVFFISGSDMIAATWGLIAGLLLQFLIYKVNSIPIPKWLLSLAVLALALAGLTLVFQDSGFIKLRPTIVGLLIASLLLGSVLLRRNIIKMIVGSMINFPDKTWNTIAVLWCLPLIANALLNLVMANLLPWPNFNFTDETWVFYRLVGGFVVTGLSLGLTIGYIILTKQHKHLTGPGDSSES